MDLFCVCRFICWTHTFILHDVADNLSDCVIVITDGVIQVWKRRRQTSILAWLSILKAALMGKPTEN